MQSVSVHSYLSAVHCEGDLKDDLERDLKRDAHISGEGFVRFPYSFSVKCRADRGMMFSDDALEKLMTGITASLERGKVQPEDRIRALQIFTKYLLISRASVFHGIEEVEGSADRSNASLKGNLDTDFMRFISDEREPVARLASEVKEMVFKATFRDLSNDEVLIDTILQNISKRLEIAEDVSVEIRIRFIQIICKYLILAQLKLMEDSEVEEAVLNKHKNAGLAQIEAFKTGDYSSVLEGAGRERVESYMGAIHSFVAEFNPRVVASCKIRPDIVDHVWCCDFQHADGLPETFRHTLPYLAYLKMMFKDVKSVDQIPADWKNQFENRFLLSENEQALFKLAMMGYFPKLSKSSVSGVERTVRRLLAGSKVGKYKDWFELLRKRQGDNYEIAKGITLKDLGNL